MKEREFKVGDRVIFNGTIGIVLSSCGEHSQVEFGGGACTLANNELEKAFDNGDRVKFDGITGTVKSWRYNFFYQLVFDVEFENGETKEIPYYQLERV